MTMFTKEAASQINFFISRSNEESPWVLWGGALPSGSLKYLTFRHYLGLQPAASVEGANGLIEISEGCSALALDLLGQELGLNTAAVCSEAGARYLKSRGFRGECLPCQSLEEALALCHQKSGQGWIWPKQMTNRDLVECVESWTRQLADRLHERRVGILEVVTGFGTGATAVGLRRTFATRGARVIAVENRPDQKIHGWRHFASQNLGPIDLFYPFAEEVDRLQSEAETEDPLTALLHSPSQVRPNQRLIITHNLIPPGSGEYEHCGGP